MWTIHYEKEPEKFLEKADRPTKIRILRSLKKILDDPRSFGKPLIGALSGLWRYRVGDYRIICKLKDEELLILVIDIGHRSKIYDK